jgi:hypothetical protein
MKFKHCTDQRKTYKANFATNALLIILCSATLVGSVLASNTSLAASVGIWTGCGETDVLFTVNAYKETWYIHQLLAHADVALLDEHASVVDGFCKM